MKFARSESRAMLASALPSATKLEFKFKFVGGPDAVIASGPIFFGFIFVVTVS